MDDSKGMEALMFAAAEPRTRRDWVLVGVLLLAAVASKTWLISQSLMFARDGVGFIELAQCLKEEPWGQVIRKSHQHPLYPINLWATASVAERVVGHPLSNLEWQNCAHLANAWASVLAIIPMYWLGRRLGGRFVAFGGCLLFFLLPMPALIFSDTLSEGTYFLFLLTGAWAAVKGLENRQIGWFAMAGLCGGLAFLARPEGAMLPVVAGLMLLVCGLRQLSGWSVRPMVAAGVLLVLCTLCVTGPYWYTIGGLGKKTTFQDMLRVDAVGVPPTLALPLQGGGDKKPMLLASRFQPGTDGSDWTDLTVVFVAKEVLWEVTRGCNYYVLPFALLGLVLFLLGTAGRRQPGAQLLLLLGLLNWVLLWWLGWKARYVSERHTVLITLFCCFFALLVVEWLAVRLAARWPNLRPRHWAAVGLSLFIAVSLIDSVRPQHRQRLAHREAGFWLKDQLKPGDEVIDPYGYAAFFAGQRTIYKKPLPRTPDNNTYLVFEPFEKDKHRLKVASKVRDRGELVKSWPKPEKPRVVIYRSKEPSGPPTMTAGK